MKRPRPSTPSFGLLGWLEQTEIHLPLKLVECRFAVSGPAVDVQIDQVFHQTATRPLDVTYTFPLPSRAAVYRCEMIVNERVIRARVEEREAARQLAAKMKAEGRRTALVEMERKNVFTLSLGNVQPGDVIVIRFAYIEELDAWKDEWALQPRQKKSAFKFGPSLPNFPNLTAQKRRPSLRFHEEENADRVTTSAEADKNGHWHCHGLDAGKCRARLRGYLQLQVPEVRAHPHV